jgi:hypothetical protein
MASFVVMAHSDASPDSSGEVVFIRDGFHFLAFLLPVIWLAWHRLWLEALVVLALALGLGALGNVFAADFAAFFAGLLLSAYVGLEGPALRIAALRRRGWRELAVIEAGNREEAELRFLAEEPPPSIPRTGARRVPLSARDDGPALGLLAYPWRR